MDNSCAGESTAPKRLPPLLDPTRAGFARSPISGRSKLPARQAAPEAKTETLDQARLTARKITITPYPDERRPRPLARPRSSTLTSSRPAHRKNSEFRKNSRSTLKRGYGLTARRGKAAPDAKADINRAWRVATRHTNRSSRIACDPCQSAIKAPRPECLAERGGSPSVAGCLCGTNTGPLGGSEGVAKG